MATIRQFQTLRRWRTASNASAGTTAFPRFCDLYGAWRRRITPNLRRTHNADEKPFAVGCGVDSTEARCYPFATFKGSGDTWKDVGKEGKFLRRSSRVLKGGENGM
jgi:hypothetical protein